MSIHTVSKHVRWQYQAWLLLFAFIVTCCSALLCTDNALAWDGHSHVFVAAALQLIALLKWMHHCLETSH